MEFALNDAIMVVAFAPFAGVLIEVPVMLLVVRVVNGTREWYPCPVRAR